MSYRSAKKALQRRRRISHWLDTWGEHGAKAFRLCGHGKYHGWSVLLANTLIPATGCACCAVMRGMFLGGVVASMFWCLLFLLVR